MNFSDEYFKFLKNYKLIVDNNHRTLKYLVEHNKFLLNHIRLNILHTYIFVLKMYALAVSDSVSDIFTRVAKN